jgi:hypothetical protein
MGRLVERGVSTFSATGFSGISPPRPFQAARARATRHTRRQTLHRKKHFSELSLDRFVKFQQVARDREAHPRNSSLMKQTSPHVANSQLALPFAREKSWSIFGIARVELSR